MMNEIITLQSEIKELVNGYYNVKFEARNVFAEIKTPSRAEFFQSCQAGLKASVVFVIDRTEYMNENTVIYKEKKYKVIRCYSKDMNYIELTCSEVI